MPSRQQPKRPAEREREQHQQVVEDERGWAGQYGQRPAEEEKNYRAGNYRGEQPANSKSKSL